MKIDIYWLLSNRLSDAGLLWFIKTYGAYACIPVEELVSNLNKLCFFDTLSWLITTAKLTIVLPYVEYDKYYKDGYLTHIKWRD